MDEADDPDGGRPTASIGVLVYNERPHLREALDSVVDQRFDDYEVVVCDDASTDGSGEICRDYADRHDRVRYVRHRRNHGSVFTFNQALLLARGRYFAWTGGHDVRAPEFLATCVAFLDDHPDVALCHTGVEVVDDEGRQVRTVDDHVDACQDDTYDRVRSVLWQMASRVSVDPMYGLFRRDVLASTRGHRNHWGPDNRIVLETALRGGIAFVEEPLFRRRVNRSPSSSLFRHIEDYFGRLDPRNRDGAVRRTYLDLIDRYHDVIDGSDLSPSEKRRLRLHATASVWTNFAGEIAVHDVAFPTLASAFGRRSAERLLSPLDRVARALRYRDHPGLE